MSLRKSYHRGACLLLERMYPSLVISVPRNSNGAGTTRAPRRAALLTRNVLYQLFLASTTDVRALSQTVTAVSYSSVGLCDAHCNSRSADCLISVQFASIALRTATMVDIIVVVHRCLVAVVPHEFKRAFGILAGGKT